MIISLVGFFHFFKILIFQVVRGVKGQETVQNDKNFCPSCFVSQELYIIWLSCMVHMCKMIISPDSLFFHFFKILICRVVRWVKGQKMVQNDKKFCRLRMISQEPYIIWLSFVVHICKMISPHVFFIFQNFDFSGYQGAERAKNGPKWQKNLSVTPYISGTIYHMSFICSTQICIKGWYLQAFTLFSSKIWFLGSLGGTG